MNDEEYSSQELPCCYICGQPSVGDVGKFYPKSTVNLSIKVCDKHYNEFDAFRKEELKKKKIK